MKIRTFFTFIAMISVLMSMSECERRETPITSFTIDGINYCSMSYASDDFFVVMYQKTYWLEIYEDNTMPAFQLQCTNHELKSDKGQMVNFGMRLSFPETLKIERTYLLSESIGSKDYMYVRSFRTLNGVREISREWFAKEGWIRFIQCERLDSGQYEISAEFEFMAVDSVYRDTVYVKKGKIFASMDEFY